MYCNPTDAAAEARRFGIDESMSANDQCDEIRPHYHHAETCMETVPEAITAFLEGISFEDAIRTAVSPGGDCDTLTAVAGSIAYGGKDMSDSQNRQGASGLGKADYVPGTEELLFFDGKPEALGLYQIFADRIFSDFPDVGMRVQKTQITFTNPKVFACVSFAKVRKAKERPKEYIVVTVGLHEQIHSSRIDAATEPYSGRWTHHVLLEKPEEIDEELMTWVRKAYHYAKIK